MNFWTSLYADDGAFFFETRADMIAGTQAMGSMMRRFGLEMHTGVGFCTNACPDKCREHKKSKTEALYVPPADQSYHDADTSPFEADGGYITFCKEFKYLGSLITWDLNDSVDVRKRIDKASSAFGALRTCIFGNKAISLAAKWTTYMVLVVPILLYGSDAWTLRVSDIYELRLFHRRCVRAMHGVKIRLRRSTRALLQAFGPRGCSMDHLVESRFMRWIGHVSRMDHDRLPRQLLFSWVRQPRRAGGQYMTIGRRIARNLKILPQETKAQLGGPEWDNGMDRGWVALAEDRPAWRTSVVEAAIGPFHGQMPGYAQKK